jgi:hypothetical protein
MVRCGYRGRGARRQPAACVAFWLLKFPFGTVFGVLVFLPWLKAGPFANWPAGVSGRLVLAWLPLTLFMGFFWYYKERLLPAASITFTHELGFVRRYGSELGLLLGLLALAAAVYMWAVPYTK